MPSRNLLELTKKYLNSQHIFVHEPWLIECLEHFLGSYTERDVEIIQSNVREQWLLHDIKDICPGSLPPNLKQVEETTLHSTYVLQINSIFDIGRPAYQQYLELQNVNTEDIEVTKTYEEKIPSCRMLKLNMTDGVQDVIGIEYKTLKNLSANTVPGIKILVKGPVKCRRGTLLLSDQNCQVLDGEVESLIAENCQKVLLEQKLGLQSVTNNGLTGANHQTNHPPPHCRPPKTNTESSASHFPPSSTTKPAVTEPTLAFINNISATRPVNSAAASTPTSTTSRTTLEECVRLKANEEPDFEGLDLDIDPSELDKIEAQYSGSVRRPSDDTTPQPEKKMKLDRNDEFPLNDEDVYLDEEFMRDVYDAMVDPVRKEVFTISEINNAKDKAGKVFVVKAKILTMLSKLSVTETSWKSSCTLTDDTGTIDVDLSNKALERIVGYTPNQMNIMKKQLKTQPELKEKIKLILVQAKENFQVLHCKMKIEFKSSIDNPIVTELIDF